MIFFSVVNEKCPKARPTMPPMMRTRPTIDIGFMIMLRGNQEKNKQYPPSVEHRRRGANSDIGLRLYAAHDQQYDHDDQHQSQTAARTVTPSTSIGPGGSR